MDFTKEDFKNLKYNCYDIPNGKDLLKEFSEIGRIKEFHVSIENINAIIRYIIYCYDPKSPLLQEKNLIKRKIIAAKLSGFEVNNGKFDALTEEIMKGRNEAINRMICAYVRQQKNIQYSLLIAGMENFYDNISKLSAPNPSMEMQEMVKKSQLYEYTVDMISSLEKNASIAFNGDVDLMYVADEMELEDQGKIMSYPEYIASMRESGNLEKVFKEVEN